MQYSATRHRDTPMSLKSFTMKVFCHNLQVAEALLIASNIHSFEELKDRNEESGNGSPNTSPNGQFHLEYL